MARPEPSRGAERPNVRREILVVRQVVAAAEVDVGAKRLPLGSQEAVKEVLAGAFGEGVWPAPDQGLFDGSGFSVLAKVGIFPVVDTMTLEVWGEADAVRQINELCLPHEWQAIDLVSGETVTQA